MPAQKTKQAAAKKEVPSPAPVVAEPVKQEVPVEAPATTATPAKKTAPKKKAGTTTTAAPKKKAEVVKKPASSDEEEEDAGEGGVRFFKILIDRIQPQNGCPAISPDSLSLKGGRFKGRNPMQAAKKAFTGICNAASKSGYEGKCTYIYTIQETTQGSAKKEFSYHGERYKLDVPQLVKKHETEYLVKFSGNVKSYKIPEESAPKKAETPKKANAKATPAKTQKAQPTKKKAKAEVAQPVAEQPVVEAAPVVEAPVVEAAPLQPVVEVPAAQPVAESSQPSQQKSNGQKQPPRGRGRGGR